MTRGHCLPWIALSISLVASCGRAEAPVEDPARAAAAADRTATVRALDHGVTVRELAVPRPDGAMLVWIYRPAPTFAGPRPVVLIGSAGTPLIWGMKLGEGDRAEHLPWAEHGYLVVAYSLDGHVDDPQNTRAIQAAIRAFLHAHAGLDNARAALDLALATEPRADRHRIYAVGHSSAATLALRVGAELPEVQAIVAFNPITNVEARIAPYRQDLTLLDRLALPVLRDSSPMAHVAALRAKPVFLFHTVTDEAVPVAESARLAQAMKPLAEPTRVVILPTGDHYHAMLERGIPAAIAWLDARAGLVQPAQAAK